MAYSYVLIGDENLSMAKSRKELAYDFSMEAITRYLNEPNKFDPSRNPDLIKYLKYNLVRQLISNAKNTGFYHYDKTPSTPEEDYYYTLKSEFKLDEKIDMKKIVSIVEERLTDDVDLFQIFKGRYYEESKRSEICDDLDISLKEYDNRLKRLKRLVKKVQQDLNDKTN
ncbi:sigma-70 family RNA polymerase sigma factor [Salegentibacter maritimus]|uniref:sigma-70 family RNA polymerase sigma factor n=1 Tax=Salegentibacter maritimus TaxID=2794347 RepID=UPI0018E4743D|nr:sigma-70 family RNA polymerase sigma factor [Salegentibacter maritimus]MBI6117963.1 sigma-70 family RNA polymerase sigma factor [Salegentibacter maritimus]